VIANKTEDFSLSFGITIGIFCIISVFTVLDWMGKIDRENINSMGSNVIYVQKIPWSLNRNLAWWDIIRWPSVSLNDYQAVLNRSAKAEVVLWLQLRPKRLNTDTQCGNDVFGCSDR